MTKNTIIYFVHIAIITATVYFASRANVASWYFVSLIGIPLILSFIPRFSKASYTINVRILFPISIGLFCISLYHFFPQLLIGDSEELARYGISNDGINFQNEFFIVNPVFTDAVAVLYAICVAFLLWKGLSDFDELKHVLYEETSVIRSITDYSSYFLTSGRPKENAPTISILRSFLLSYVNNIISGNQIVTSTENEEILEKCLVTVGSLKPADLNDEIALSEIMKGISSLSVLRSKRSVCIEKRMSPYILVLMFMMSVTMVSSFFGKATGEISFEYFYVFLLPTFYASIFMTLLDLSSPFDGYWSIKIDAVRGIKQKLEEHLGTVMT